MPRGSYCTRYTIIFESSAENPKTLTPTLYTPMCRAPSPSSRLLERRYLRSWYPYQRQPGEERRASKRIRAARRRLGICGSVLSCVRELCNPSTGCARRSRARGALRAVAGGTTSEALGRMDRAARTPRYQRIFRATMLRGVSAPVWRPRRPSAPARRAGGRPPRIGARGTRAAEPQRGSPAAQGFAASVSL